MTMWSRIKRPWSEKGRGEPEASSGPTSPTSSEQTEPPPPTKSYKILVVDDNPVILKTLTFKLQSKGYQVSTAADGAEGVSSARRDKPDLILLDISFPPDVSFGGGVSWDGFRIMDWLQRTNEVSPIPIIVITGGDPAKYEVQARKAGAAGFFQKPINHEDLLKTIHQILDEKTAPPGTPPNSGAEI